ncbi:Lrp/AsnC family transcriptional regulator [Natrarchaeobius chitinivorans]|uniref:Lrp/AsnC family transcriptional regulator n=1 Tax=Natrarchaeobius chitinivorans TaxID=1679083 RepID=A0A3N6M817_NATCH|nr:Lrp/AsnC family transcriptional regulator [Natrarchaeobius chitinivorans]RQG89556.1 Lrp/AsnC family transcriptional regulator [Natrarchaeobius chitinivorans]
MARELDNVDRGILYMLQLDARNTTSEEIADKTGVSASTIRNRIERLEDDGVVKGYHPEIDYESANLPLRVMFVITAPPKQRSEAVDQLLDIHGVIDVREMLTGNRNIQVEVVGRDTSDIVRITDAIHDLGVEVDSSEIMKQRKVQPFNHFYFSEAVDDITRQEDDSETE